jgi:hypothetical protein
MDVHRRDSSEGPLKMQLFKLTHYRADLKGADECVKLLESEPRHLALQSKYPAAVSFVSERCINWPQTFARKGLRREDFYQLTPKFATLHRFERGLPLDDGSFLVSFSQEGDPEAALQGEVFMYTKTAPELRATCERVLQLKLEDIRMGGIKRMFEEPYVLDFDRLKRFERYLLEATHLKDFAQHFLLNWNDATSFVKAERL